MKKIFPLFWIALVLFSCKKEAAYTDVPANDVSELKSITALPDFPITSHAVQPTATDPNINTQTLGNPVQTAYLPQYAQLRKDKLFIFIPGTFGVPQNYDYLLQAAAQTGYYSFGVAYSNLSAVEFYAFNPNDKTVENILNEYLTGDNTSGRVNVSRANSFENRIIKMIMYLDSSFVTEGWGRFITPNGNLIWDKISVAGHSQGSDHAMYMSKAHSVARAGFFGGPGSFKLNNGQYPTFMQQPGETPAENLYGFNHTKDAVRRWNDVRQTWEVLSIPGEPNSVDDRRVNGSHRLTTSAPFPDEHSAICTDDASPLDANGKPVYKPVWAYMCFP